MAPACCALRRWTKLGNELCEAARGTRRHATGAWIILYHATRMDWYWWAFFLFLVGVLLGMDLGFFQRKAHEVKISEAIQSTTLRVALALLFWLGIYLGWIGGYDTPGLRAKAGVEFLTGYLIEIALSIDNVFVFALVFQYFRVPPLYQHRILFWGILGALIMRGILIFAGIALIE